MFTKGQIVKGKVTGVFVVVGHKMVGGEAMVILKAVNPANHSQVGRGYVYLPTTVLVAA